MSAKRPNTTFVMKTGDTRPAIRGLITTESDDVITDVRFKMRDSSGTVVIDEEGACDEQPAADDNGDSTGAVVSYQWVSGDTDDAGRFPAVFRVTFADGRQETFPAEGYLTVLIGENI